VNDGFQVNFFGSNQGKTLRQIKAHLVTKNRQSTAASAITFAMTFADNFVK
jgi:hypothetical protein